MGDDKRKHLEFIQNAINRMATNSFRLKTWTVLLISALMAFFTRYGESDWYSIAIIIPILAFWGLDGYFLSQERLFRSLYDRVRTLKDADIDYSMDTRDFRQIPRNGWRKSALSRTLIAFYAPLLAVALAVAILAAADALALAILAAQNLW